MKKRITAGIKKSKRGTFRYYKIGSSNWVGTHTKKKKRK